MQLPRAWYRFGLLLSSILATCVTLTTPATRYLGPRYSRDRLSRSAAPIVDLGYALYQGYYDSEFHLNVFKGCAVTANTLRQEKSINTHLPASDTLLLQ